MMEKRNTGLRAVLAIAITFSTGFIGLGSLSAQEASKGPTENEKRLIRRTTDEVIKELHESDFLQKEIEAGIERYVKKQQALARAPDKKAAKNVRPVDVTRDHILGNPDAEMSLIEYSDFECPYCKSFYPTAKEIVKTYAGKVNWVYRHFPLGFHNPGAQQEAEASECAAELGGNDAFWAYADQIYTYTRSNGKGFAASMLVPTAVEIGLEEEPFTECLESGRHAARVQADLENGTQSGITGTPGNILLNHKTGQARLVAGALPLATFKTVIDQMLAK